MQQSNFKLSRSNNVIILEKNNELFFISKTPENHIWFLTKNNNLAFELNFLSDNNSEYQTYIIFENLIKCIIGRYILNNDDKKKFLSLPRDFIDLENKIITIYSDGDIGNTLKIKHNTNTITIEIIKSKYAKKHHNNSVKICNDFSNYQMYSQEFINFFNQITFLEQNLNEINLSNELKNEYSSQKKLSFFNKFKRK